MEERFIQLIQDHEGVLHKVINLYTQGGSEREDLY